MKYKTVVIDPPWAMSVSKPPDRAGRLHTLSHNLEYNSMSIREITKFPIDDFAADECQLFLWVINGKIKGKSGIEHGFNILREWGFEYHNIITWVKSNCFALWSPILNKTEHVLYGFRGGLARDKMGVMKNVFNAPVTKHSEKPAQFYQKLREWTPEPRIDLFARQAHYGFDGWGDEYVGEGPLMEFLGT